MHSIARLAALSAFVLATAGIASANTVEIGSYASTAANPANYANTATYNLNTSTNIVQSTYNIGIGDVWTAPVGSSSWVSLNANSYPGGSYVAPNGSYSYQTSFSEVLPAGSVASGTISVMADDTTSIYLNGNLVLAAADADPSAHCTVGTPNCITPVSVFLPSSDFVSGQNTLNFVVSQDFGSATGLDFEGSITNTPEPGSLVLLGTGLLSGAGAMFRRFRS